jgi:hypothetical protein
MNRESGDGGEYFFQKVGRGGRGKSGKQKRTITREKVRNNGRDGGKKRERQSW